MNTGLPRGRNRVFYLNCLWAGMVVALVGGGCFPSTARVEPVLAPPVLELSQRPQNIILLVGSGMGLSQISGGMYRQADHTALERCTASGLHKPLSLNSIITGPSAGATALSIGVPTYQGAIGVGPDSMRLPNLMELAQAQGWLSGLVTSGRLTDPTPAAFYAHVKREDNRALIAAQLADAGLNFFIGGGLDDFKTSPSGGLNAQEKLEKAGYDVFDYSQYPLSELPWVTSTSGKIGCFVRAETYTASKNGEAYLPGALEKATGYLSGIRPSRGFFLVLDGGQIHEAGQANDSPALLAEMVEFDQTVGKALDFAEQNQGTLVVVTGSHETGGYALKIGSSRDSIIGGFTTREPTATLIPVFAFGPGAELFNGVFNNYEIFSKLRIAMGL